MKREKTYPFSTEGFEQCMADIRAEKSHQIINRNITVSFVALFVILAMASNPGTLAFTHTVYELIPSVPMPLIP